MSSLPEVNGRDNAVRLSRAATAILVGCALMGLPVIVQVLDLLVSVTIGDGVISRALGWGAYAYLGVPPGLLLIVAGIIAKIADRAASRK